MNEASQLILSVILPIRPDIYVIITLSLISIITVVSSTTSNIVDYNILIFFVVCVRKLITLEKTFSTQVDSSSSTELDANTQ